MRVIGHGVDIVAVARLAGSLAQFGQRFHERVFSQAEFDYAAKSRRRNEHLAARFAAKEAVFKALGTGWGDGVAWTDVEVVRLETGQPTIRLAGKAAERAASMGIREWSLSLSHTAEWAVASAIAMGD